MPVLITSESPGLLLRVPEVAAFLGIHPRALYRWIDARLIPEEVLFRVGRRIFFRRAEFEAWLKTRDLHAAQR